MKIDCNVSSMVAAKLPLSYKTPRLQKCMLCTGPLNENNLVLKMLTKPGVCDQVVIFRSGEEMGFHQTNGQTDRFTAFHILKIQYMTCTRPLYVRIDGEYEKITLKESQHRDPIFFKKKLSFKILFRIVF